MATEQAARPKRVKLTEDRSWATTGAVADVLQWDAHGNPAVLGLFGFRMWLCEGWEPADEPTPAPTAHANLTEAADIEQGARQQTHGDKERSLDAIAGLWNAYLSARKSNGPLVPRDVASMMVLLKLARSVQSEPARDHFVDAAGYAALAGELGMGEGVK